MTEIETLRNEVRELTVRLKRFEDAIPYRNLGNVTEFDRIVIAKNRLIVPEKNQDTDGRNGEVITNGAHGYMRVNNTWKQIT